MSPLFSGSVCWNTACYCCYCLLYRLPLLDSTCRMVLLYFRSCIRGGHCDGRCSWKRDDFYQFTKWSTSTHYIVCPILNQAGTSSGFRFYRRCGEQVTDHPPLLCMASVETSDLVSAQYAFFFFEKKKKKKRKSLHPQSLNSHNGVV